jgi:hypothetical protein
LRLFAILPRALWYHRDAPSRFHRVDHTLILHGLILGLMMQHRSVQNLEFVSESQTPSDLSAMLRLSIGAPKAARPRGTSGGLVGILLACYEIVKTL